MNRLLLLVAFVTFSMTTIAHPTCSGVVTKIIDDGLLRVRYGDLGIHNICSFGDEKSLTRCERWLSLVLTAQATGKTLSVQYWGEGKTCDDVTIGNSQSANLAAIALHLTNN